MNIVRRIALFRCNGLISSSRMVAPQLPGSSATQLRALSSWVLSPLGRHGPLHGGTLPSQAEGAGVFQQLPWHYQQVRTGKRGTEYQPKVLKRKRTHGWIKRISTQGGIEVILRRMLKGRKSLSH